MFDKSKFNVWLEDKFKNINTCDSDAETIKIEQIDSKKIKITEACG